MDSTKVFLNNKTVGEVRGEIFRKHVKFRHFLRTPRAIAYDLEVLEQAKRAGARALLVIAENELEYRISFDDFDKHSFFIDRGYGSQKACRLEYWEKSKPGCKQDIVEQLAMPIF